MQLIELKERIRYFIEDTKKTLYDDNEVLAAINIVKDEVLALILMFTENFPLTTVTLSFLSGSAEVTTTTKILKLVEVWSIKDGIKYNHSIKGIQFAAGFNKDYPEDFYYLAKTNGDFVFGRNTTENALTLYIRCVVELADVLNDTDDIEFGPKPTNLLLIYKTAELLFRTRRRTESAQLMMQKAKELEEVLKENLKSFISSGPRYVQYSG